MEEVKAIPSDVDESMTEGRLDFRGKCIFTIDGDDSKDFDDAVSIELKENGNYILGVHIADVSYYVKRGSEIDKEALNRANSIYLPDMVYPMLPEELSNGICSLKENEDRLTISCLMEFDKSSGTLVDYDIKRSVIRSTHRLTYKNVQRVIDGDIPEGMEEVINDIQLMNKLRLVLNKVATNKGRIEFEERESHPTYVDGNIQINPLDGLDARNLIEEFMIAANETVSRHIELMDLPFVYRIHEKPDARSLENILTILKNYGIKYIKNKNEVHSMDYAKILTELKGDKFYPIINKMALKSMRKAKYSTENKGHFGLASRSYCHFTSPIRRYADLEVHRILVGVMDGTIFEKDLERLEKSLLGVCEHISSREMETQRIERLFDKLYEVFFMAGHLGEEFDGIISGVVKNGFFVTLENLVEGFVDFELLGYNDYVFDEQLMTLTVGKKKYSIGDKVFVQAVLVGYRPLRAFFMSISKRREKHESSKCKQGSKI